MLNTYLGDVIIKNISMSYFLFDGSFYGWITG